MRSNAPTAKRRKRRPAKRRGGALIVVIAILFFVFALASLAGFVGDAVRDFFAGTFGFMGCAFFALALLATLLKVFGVLRKRPTTRTVWYAFVLSLILLLFLQVLTSAAEFDSLDKPVSFTAYLNACYEAGFGTSSGVLIAWLAFPFLSLIGKIAMIPLAVLFFLFLFFALLPMMRSGKKEAAPKEKSPKKEQPAAQPLKQEKSLRLYVDKVRPGQKNAKKLKLRGLFGKKPRNLSFFDYTDDTPIYRSKGVIPEEKPERYDLYSADRAETRTEDGEYDFSEMRREFARPVRAFADAREEVRSTENGDIPAFMRRYANRNESSNLEEKAEEQSASSFAAKESKTESGKGASFDSQSFAPKSASARPLRGNPRVDDIISDLSDLRRLREKEKGTESVFLGETPAPAPVREDAASTSEKPIFDFSSEESVREESAPVSEPVYTKPEPTYVKPAPLYVSETGSEPMRKSSEFSGETRQSMITPREASVMRPQEERIPRPPVLSEKRAPDPSFLEEDAAAQLRTRKPRSDIGGTHRTQEDRQASGFIPPKRMEQMDITQAMKEEREAPARPYTPPPVTLLKDIPSVQDEDGVEERAEMLVQALSSFNITSEVVDHKTGPTFTQFAVTLPDNMSVNKLTPLEKDIKRKLKVEKNIRIIPSVPGLDAVGIEVPNKKTSMVGLRSIINSPDFTKEGKLFFAIGVDVSGRAIYGDLLKMPHLLVAGSTGSGKSVCLNVLICSMMYHYSPEVVRFIMVDPKKVELSVYKNMPHMLMPSTVTEPDKAINALNWAVNEMERRYMLLMENGCRNIGEYNAMMAKTGGKRLYYIVFIVDEMADLMYTAKRDVEEKVNRIAAKARAAGIHLVVATQRPSVDVITGTIKNNIPTRIAFKVTSFTDSKTILDRAGAESLFGNGDMLYMPPEGGDPIRLQGPYINDEISEIVRFIKENNDCRFDGDAEKVIQAEKEDPAVIPDGDEGDKESGEDPLFAPSLLYFIDIGQASISKLQIKYRMGYGRAARIVEEMAERGYLGPSEGGNKPRQVRITREEYFELYGEDGIDGDEIE